MSIDVHRHRCTGRLADALGRRSRPPRLRRRRDGWRIEVAGEAPALLPDPADDLRAHDLDHAVLALSSSLGVEQLPGAEARELIGAWHADCAELPPELRAWGALPLADPTAADVEAALASGRPGISLPATALATPADLDRLGPVLEQLERRDAVLFVHPGPAGPKDWLPAVTAYPASLVVAWTAWAAHGRAQHPGLRVLFAALAGLAPLHAERLAARVGAELAERALADRRTFYDTSSYGPVAVAAVTRAVGEGRLVYGSDHPWAGSPGEHRRLPLAVGDANPRRLLAGTGWTR